MAGGQGITSAQGSLYPLNRNGIRAAFSSGTVGVSASRALTGSASTSAAGLLTPSVGAGGNLTLPVTGSAVTLAQQTIAPSWAQALAGSAITSSRGTPTVDMRPTNIVGILLTGSTGTIVANGNSVTVHVSGVETTVVAGDILATDKLIVGSQATSATGTVVQSASLLLSGQSCAVSAGLLVPAQLADDTFVQSAPGAAVGSSTVALVGEAFTGAQGNVAITGDVTLELTGSQSTAQPGSVSFSQSYDLTGLESVAAQFSVGAPGFAALSGAAVSAQAGTVFLDNDRTYPLTGIASTVGIGTAFASPVAFVSGQALTSGQGTIGPRGVTLNGLESTVEAGNVFLPSEVTDVVVYVPIRQWTQTSVLGVEEASDQRNMRSWMPPSNVPLVDKEGRINEQWRRFIDYVANYKLGGPDAPTMSDIAASLETAQEQANEAATTSSALQQVVVNNAEVLSAAAEVLQDNAIPGSEQLPPIRRYLRD